MDLFTLAAKLSIDTSGFEASFNKAIKLTPKMQEELKAIGEQSDKTGKSLEGLEKTSVFQKTITELQKAANSMQKTKEESAKFEQQWGAVLKELGGKPINLLDKEQAAKIKEAASAGSTMKTALKEDKTAADDVKEALQEVQNQAQKTGQEGSEAAGVFKSQWQDVKDSLKGIFTVSAGQLVAQGATAAFGWLKQAAGDSVELASDLNEVQNVIDKTFGSDAKSIESWAKRAKNNIGMSELAAKQYASTLGAMLKSSGLTGEQVADLSMKMVNLAGDMASFYNLDHDTAFEKIRSGISGETEPLKQLGVNMSVANLEAFRLQQGIGTAYDKMSQSEQVELRIQYLSQAMSDAAGDFAATAESYANSKKTLEANIQTLESNIGQFILPLVQDAVSAVNSLFEGDTSVSAKLKAIDQELTASQIENALNTAGVEALIDSLEQQEAEMFSRIGQEQQVADTMSASLEEVAQKSNAVNSAQATWNKTVEALKISLPEASGLIDTQTGAINGGTEALQAFVDAWNVDDEKLTTVQALVDTLKDLEANGFTPGEVQTEGNAVTGVMADMALETARTEEEQAQWMATLQKILEIMPEAADLINLQTGEIEGGTKALRENTKAWEENLRIQAIKSAGNQYQELLATAISTAAGAKVENQIAQTALNQLRPRLEELYGKTWASSNTPFADWVMRPTYSGLSSDEKAEADLLRQRYIENQRIVAEYSRNVEQYQADIEEAAEKNRLYNETYAEYLESATTGPGVSASATVETLTHTADEYTAVLEQEMTTAEALRDKVKELADAHEELLRATEQSVNALLGGWKKVDAINGMTGEGEDAVAFDINEYIEVMQAQKAFADQYRNMLADLRQRDDISQDFLAYLAANPTEENAEILNVMHTNPVGDQAQALSQAYDEKVAAINKLVEESTDLQDKFSTTIQEMKDDVVALTEAFNQAEAARENMRATVAGGVEGLEDSLPDLQEIMDEIRSAVETGLDWSGIQVRLPNIAGAASTLSSAVSGLRNVGGKFGSFSPVQLDERAVGLDYVPYDGYLASLHEGERIMTKLENRQFSMGEFSGQGADLGALPGLIVAAVRDGMANISVQIDGQEAGRILIEPISRGIAEQARVGRYAG